MPRKKSVDLVPKITQAEEICARGYVGGREPLELFREAYPENSCEDRKARYRFKKIIERPHVQAYIEHLQRTGDVTDQITESSIKAYLWQTALRNPDTHLGLKAATTLGKEFGIGTETLVIKDETNYDTMLEEIHEYYTALENGETPALPACVIGNGEDAEEVEFKIIGEDDDEDDE